jgi:mono/diheme cytochrome c family protein
LPVQSFLDEEIYMTASPAGAWLALRARPELARLDDVALWDAVAAFWHAQATPEALALGARLYRRDCAACHGENGAGDGVFARTGGAQDLALRGHALEPATDFTNPNLLGASNVLLQGKIIRGGMGTGMPAWGSVYAKEELAALLAHLWTFQFPRPAH